MGYSIIEILRFGSSLITRRKYYLLFGAITKRRLGKTEIWVSPVGLGCWQFSGGVIGSFYWDSVSKTRADEIVKVSLEGGVNFFDTAELYGFSRSEKMLSAALTKAGIADRKVVVATKWLPILKTANSIRKTIANRQAALAPFGIELYQVHNPSSISSVEEQMDAMADLVEQKKIGAIGVSNFSPELMRRAHRALAKRGISLASNQVRYSLLDRHIEKDGTLEAAKELGITIIAYSPLAQGVLTGRFHRDPGSINKLPFIRRRIVRRMVEKSRPQVEMLREMSTFYGVSTAQIALNWLINYSGDMIVAIPGATKAEQAAQNAYAMSFTLSPSDMKRLDSLCNNSGVF
jgi:aryl-alcohol dehydrogenase-like predicted oxidoreductase